MLHLDFQNDILAPEDNMKYLNIQNTILHEHIKKPMIEVFVKQLESEDKYLLYHGLVGLRKLVSHENDPQIERAIQLGAVPLLFDVIKNNITPYHTYEACYSLTNVASGDSKQTATVADLGGVNLFVELTKCNFYDIVEQSIWALGNLAGDNNDYREEIIKLGGHKTIIQFALFCEEKMDNYKKSSSYAQCVWALTNLCLVDQINKDLINEIMPIVCRSLNYQFLKQTIVEVLTSISQFTKHQEVINILIENQQQLKSLLGYLHNKDTEVIRLALNILIDISMGNKEQVNHLIQLKLLLYIPKLLEHKNFKIRKLTCQLLQMIAISSQEYTILILKDKQIMNKLCHLAINDDKIIEVIKIYFNMTEFLLVEDLQTLINYQFLNIIQNCIARQERGDINFVINSIKNLLKNIDPNLLRQQFYGFVQEIQNFATTQDWKQELQDLEYIQQKFDKYQMNQ